MVEPVAVGLGVGVDECDDAAGGGFESRITRRGQSTMLETERAEASSLCTLRDIGG